MSFGGYITIFVIVMFVAWIIDKISGGGNNSPQSIKDMEALSNFKY